MIKTCRARDWKKPSDAASSQGISTGKSNLCSLTEFRERKRAERRGLSNLLFCALSYTMGKCDSFYRIAAFRYFIEIANGKNSTCSILGLLQLCSFVGKTQVTYWHILWYHLCPICFQILLKCLDSLCCAGICLCILNALLTSKS